MNRPTFLRSLALTGLFAQAVLPASTRSAAPAVIKPRRLRPGDTVGLINPAGATFQTMDIEIVKESLYALGLQVVLGAHVLDRYGYLAGKDGNRADDVNRMFADPSVKAILCIRGGWGSNRILPLLDYNLIRKNPKIIMGYSDVSSLLVALYAKCGLVTFHGPVGISTWNSFSTDYVKRILLDGDTVILRNPVTPGDTLAQTKDRIEVITPGRAQGRLIGGNLSVLSSIIGSSYLPDWEHHILFLEETDEQIYRVDRMLTQVKLAGILDKLAGVVFGKCTNCGPGEGYGSLTLEEVFRDHIKPLGVPAWSGAMIGHIENKFTVPIGIEVEIDARKGTIQMLEPAVQ